MKRKPKLNNANRIWPWLLWKRCYNCQMDFRREWGWKKTFSLPLPIPNNTTRYLCDFCALNLAEANIIFSRIIKQLINRI